MNTESAIQKLKTERASWNAKPGLRTVYEECYGQILAACVEGNILEVGSGSGNLKRFAPDVTATDIVEVPWVDLVTDATHLPFQNNTVSNLICFDTLHHIEYPTHFFVEAERILTSGGRLILCEPAITPWSKPFYKFLHHEPVDMKANPFIIGAQNDCRDPFDANQAMPTLIFFKENEKFQSIFPNLLIKRTDLLSLFAYPLSGGFRWWHLLPQKLIPSLLRLEKYLLPLVGKYMAFRMLVVIEHIRND